MYKLKQFLEENQDFKNYINTRINDNIDLNIIYDELDILHNDFKIDDLIEYKNSDDFKKQIPIINNEINNKDNINKISFNINFDESLKIFKTQNLENGGYIVYCV